ncbi:hypothetical protein CHLNCDRAFT_55451 [Chlorella variabilis]|uniref:Uncharacterized protein n=1 Tax=Chlorella variabilis TaxID=554065 RepID=E1ZTB3_CHLVA|nr:hypothetical protein CHLNCDRAFT_55451 [Chlorella variabilis]EFN50903.1 hypothetical protein CHLNCDRAFT_55451 [Chlorella variabilis]|eukprot:XP_005843005.1 hypothetical protein CHLNCDRAFT_55451 [Chlorella variabilis]
MVERAATDPDRDRVNAKVMEQVEASARVVEELMAEVSREAFINAAVSRVTESEAPESSLADVVGAAVGRRMEELDATFLATLDGYIRGASDKGAADVAEVLLLVRQEVLRRLGARLPPEMQLLDAAMAAADSKARMELLRKYALPSEQALAEALAGGEGEAGGIRGSLASAAVSSSQAGSEGLDRASSASSSRSAEQQPEGSGAVPVSLLYCLAADLERAASQVIRDMELMMEVPDRRLLARLVLAREELQQMLLEAAFMGGEGSGGDDVEVAASFRQPFQQLGAVPKSCAAFLQRLMALPGPQEREGLLLQALSEDVERLPGAGQPGPDATTRERLRAQAEAPQDWVRPGRFMQSLSALQAEMLGQAASGSDGQVPNSDVLERLESIRREALGVLLGIAGEGQTAAADKEEEEEEPYLP